MHVIRTANPGDAQRLSRLAEATFRDTFAGVNTAADMHVHCRASYSQAIQAGEIADPGMLTFLCEEEGEKLIGFAQLRWRGAPGCVRAQAPGEIQRLYVIGSRHGQGIAQELMTACLHEMETRGSDVAWLGVWESNPRAISFYRKFGFVEVGEHVFPLGSDPQRDLVMARAVTVHPPG